MDGDINHMLTLMRDVHRFTARQLGDERMWPLSMPCYIEQGQDIELAQYGTSNIGRLKTLYREGLKPLWRVDADHLRCPLQLLFADGVLAGEVR